MRNDATAFRALWTPDCEWKINEPLPLLARGVDGAAQALSKLMGQWEVFAHLPHSVLVEVRGDEARARCTVEEIGINRKAGKSYHNLAFYFDKLRHLDGQWLFQSRSYHYLWLDDRPLTGQTFPASSLPVWAVADRTS